VLRRHVFPILGASPRTVCEIGCGSGFLLCSLLVEFGSCGAGFLASDVSGEAIALTRHNVERTRTLFRKRWAPHEPAVELAHTDDLLSRLAAGSVDLLITNPPYIPGYRNGEINAYEGTTIIEDLLLVNGPRVLSERGVMVILYSSLSARVVETYLKKTPLVGFPVGEPMRVPLDLREVLGDPRWMQHLHGQGLEEDVDCQDYTFWHKIQIACFVQPSYPLRGDR
jgi:methylase of polypeptide subunit release factors